MKKPRHPFGRLLLVLSTAGCARLLGFEDHTVVDDPSSRSIAGDAGLGGTGADGAGGVISTSGDGGRAAAGDGARAAAGDGGRAEAGDGGIGGLPGGETGCPGHAGPTMVRLREGYCIDSTEVTRAQYQAWLDDEPSLDGRRPECAFKVGFAPDATCMKNLQVCAGEGCGDHPVVCVDWCDAEAYCRDAGKRLCGKIGGGPFAYNRYADFTQSQQYNACSAHGTLSYVYGTTLEPNPCNGSTVASSSYLTVPVGSMASCQSPVATYAGIYDLSGNVWEFQDSCRDGGATADCRCVGGSFRHEYMECARDSWCRRNEASIDTGFRCCSDIPESEPKRAFLSKLSVAGNFGGVSVADDACQTEAREAGLSGSYLAWLGDTLGFYPDQAGSPYIRFTRPAAGYVRVDGVRVADDLDDLFDGTIAAPINVAADGTLITLAEVWTNVRVGTEPMSPAACDNWTGSASVYGWSGSADASNKEWSMDQLQQCPSTRKNHFYCFEQ